MHFDIHFRKDVVDKIKDVVSDIHTWNIKDTRSKDEIDALKDRIIAFDHCVRPDRPFYIGGADGSGDFPCVAYGDSVVYLVTATTKLYAAMDRILSEVFIPDNSHVEFLWLPEDKSKGAQCYKDTFAQLLGESIEDICQESDYYDLTRGKGKSVPSPIDLADNLILPPAHDANNIGIQLLSTAESGALVRMMKQLDAIRAEGAPIYLLEDTTLALPMASSKNTLFFEIAKRFACTTARKKGISYMALSKSHNMPHMDLIEDVVLQKVPTGEHWFMRVPATSLGEEKPEFLGSRTIPPIGAVSYIFKFHKTTQPMRLDIDLQFWNENIYSPDNETQLQREIQLFRDLDFASHDQRCYGYPYPIKACHDAASMTPDERVSMRKQFIDEAVKAGLKRKNFVDPSILTGHK